jgi:hypothetical protein
MINKKDGNMSHPTILKVYLTQGVICKDKRTKKDCLINFLKKMAKNKAEKKLIRTLKSSKMELITID